MRFRELALLAVWTLLIGPVLARPVADNSETKQQVIAATDKATSTTQARR